MERSDLARLRGIFASAEQQARDTVQACARGFANVFYDGCYEVVTEAARANGTLPPEPRLIGDDIDLAEFRRRVAGAEPMDWRH